MFETLFIIITITCIINLIAYNVYDAYQHLFHKDKDDTED